MLYCLKCGKWAYKNHPCPILSLIPLTKECRGIADKLYALGIEPLSVSHFVQPVADSSYKYYITFCIELRKSYPVGILGDLPIKWKWYTETITEDRLPLQVIGYAETFVFDGVLTAEDRVQEIINQFVDYLGTRDAQATKSILTLMYS